MTAPATQPISVSDAMRSSIGSAEMVARIESAQRVRVAAEHPRSAARRMTYQPTERQRALVLTATFALLVTTALQAFAVATLL